MGGGGSGRPRLKTYGTTERFLSLDIHDLWRSGALTSRQACTVTWRSATGQIRASVGRHAGVERLWLTYSLHGPGGDARLVHEAIPVQFVSCRWGGLGRPYFHCPTCTRLAVKLYLVGTHFRCRPCHRLAFALRRVGDTRAFTNVGTLASRNPKRAEPADYEAVTCSTHAAPSALGRNTPRL